MFRSNFIYSILAAVIFPPFRRKMEILGATNLPTSGGFIIAANHVDWLDGFFLAAAVGKIRRRPLHFLTQSNNYWWTIVAVQIPPDRRGDIVGVAVDSLRAGKVICNFPEGQRNNDDKLLPGKTGTVRIAAQAAVPIVPTGVNGDYGRTMWDSVQQLCSRQRQVKITFGKPYKVELSDRDITNDRLTTETKKLMAAIAPLAGKRV